MFHSRFAAALVLTFPLALAGCALDGDVPADEDVDTTSDALTVPASASGAKAVRLWGAMRSAGMKVVSDLMDGADGSPIVYTAIGAIRISCEKSPASCTIRRGTGPSGTDTSPYTVNGPSAAELRAALDAIEGVDSTPFVRDAYCKKVEGVTTCKMKVVK